MSKRKLVQTGKGYKIYLTGDGRRIIIYNTRVNTKRMGTKVVDKDKKKKTRAQIKKKTQKEIENENDI